jgi:hypothetical protein
MSRESGVWNESGVGSQESGVFTVTRSATVISLDKLIANN